MPMTDLSPYHAYLANPADEDAEETFADSAATIWIDWGEDDTDILDYLNDRLPDNAQIAYQADGDDLYLLRDGARERVPYQGDGWDRDTTLHAANRYLAATHQIRWRLPSLGSDTLAYSVLAHADWQTLEQQHGAARVRYYLAPLDDYPAMFNLDIDEVERLLDARDETPIP